MTPVKPRPTLAHVASRICASLLGGYAFVWGFTLLGTAVAVVAGLPYEQAETLLYLLAFLVFVICFCWAFSAKSLIRVWLVLGLGGALMTGAGWLLASSLV